MLTRAMPIVEHDANPTICVHYSVACYSCAFENPTMKTQVLLTSHATKTNPFSLGRRLLCRPLCADDGTA